MASRNMDLVIGIAMVVLGLLVLLGELGLGGLLPILGVVLVVLGVLMLVNVVSGGTLKGVITIVLGLALYLDLLDLNDELTGIVNLVVGVVLLILGLMQITGR